MAEPARGRARRRRTLRETLGIITLGFELFVVFLCALAFFGLRVLPPEIAFGGGAALMALMIFGIWAMRFPWGIWLGWAIQLLITLTGVLHGAMFFAGGIFLAMWAYCMVRGGRIEAEHARMLAEHERSLAEAEGRAGDEPAGA